MIIPLKHFHDSLNIVVILARGHEFFPAICDQFPLAFTEGNQTKDIFPAELLLSFIFDIDLMKIQISKAI